MLDILFGAVDSTSHLPVGVLKKIFSQVAADEAGDARDQCPQVAPFLFVTHCLLLATC
jgi:hypothetical protein